jgi:lysozyme family protein
MTYSETFERAVAIVLAYEGGFVDDPRDAGGATNFGISQRAYPELDIAALTEDQAKAIYHRDYWEPIQGDALPAPLAIMTFDAAVNMGVGTAVRQLQTVLGCEVDGGMGPVTCGACAAVVEADELEPLAADLCARRCLDYATYEDFDTYGWGWLRRATWTFAQAFLPQEPAPEI